jgi:excisionase family DNA binding protein
MATACEIPLSERDPLTPSEVARLRRTKIDVVLGWIHNGELRATNEASVGSIRPRWRIERADLEDFLRGRSNEHKPTPKRRRRKAAEGVKKYF